MLSHQHEVLRKRSPEKPLWPTAQVSSYRSTKLCHCWALCCLICSSEQTSREQGGRERRTGTWPQRSRPDDKVMWLAFGMKVSSLFTISFRTVLSSLIFLHRQRETLLSWNDINTLCSCHWLSDLGDGSTTHIVSSKVHISAMRGRSLMTHW